MVIFICLNSEILTTLTIICSRNRPSNNDRVNCCLFLKICEQEVIFICLREEPVVFFRSDGDFIPYTPRGRENLHENVHDLDRELSAEQIELSIRKEVWYRAEQVLWGGSLAILLWWNVDRGHSVCSVSGFNTLISSPVVWLCQAEWKHVLCL